MSETWTAERLAEVLPAEVVAMVPGLEKPTTVTARDCTFVVGWSRDGQPRSPAEVEESVTAALLRALAEAVCPVRVERVRDGWVVYVGDPNAFGAPTLLEALLMARDDFKREHPALAATGHPARDGGAGE